MLFNIDLQRFAETDEDLDENLDYDEDKGYDEDDTDSEGDTADDVKDEKVEFSQEQKEEINRIIDKVFGKKKSKWEQEVTSKLGVKDLNEAIDYTQAGRAVSNSAHATPKEILNRLQAKGLYRPDGAGNQPADTNSLQRDIEEMKNILSSEREEKVKSVQEQEAVKTFGNKVYREHEDEIKEKADELGLSLTDAAAIVLKSRLPKLAEERVRKQQSEKKRKALDSGDAGAGDKSDYSSRLSNSQKMVAQKMRISYKDYYTQLKDLGRID